MRMLNIVANISIGYVYWVELILSSCNRCYCLIAPQNNRDKQCAMSSRVLGNDVLLSHQILHQLRWNIVCTTCW